MPLDILSKSGKIIHAIEKELGINAVKTNLYDMDRMPIGREIDDEAVNWWYRNEIDPDSIIVLLGRFVQDNFYYAKDKYIGQYIKLPHPASSLFRGNKTRDEYVKMAVQKIRERLNKP